MNRIFVYLFLAGFAVLLQTTLLPSLLPGDFKPDLVLVLVVYLGLHEKPVQGGLLVYLIGWLYDGFSGVFPGLHGFVLLSIFLAVRGIVTRVNTESSPLLLLLVMMGTFMQVLLIAFALDFFKVAYDPWSLLAWNLMLQITLNVLSAVILLKLIVWLQRKFLPRSELPGLRKLDSRYEP